MRRAIKDILIERINHERACALIGPRQVGKSFLLQEIIAEFGGHYLSLDDPIVREEVEKDPLDYLRNFHHEDKFLFIDEPAKVPSIFDAIKVLIDERKDRPSRICMANSGNYLLLKRVKESLAGRVSMMSLLPFSWRELRSGSSRRGGSLPPGWG